MTNLRIGVCEDDEALRSVLVRTFEAEGFKVDATMSGHDAMERFGARPPDVLVLDVGLPDSDGRDVCQALRANGVEAPVIFLTARDALTDRLSGFSAGGDDYLSKPFEISELLARVNALVKRSPTTTAIRVGELRLDPTAHALCIGERIEALTPTEFRIIASLVAKPGAVLRRAELIAAAWPEGAIVHENTLDTYIAPLRRKLDRLGADQAIDTARGVGYALR